MMVVDCDKCGRSYNDENYLAYCPHNGVDGACREHDSYTCGCAGKTKNKLATVLELEGLHNLAERARRGEFDDYESESATPLMDLEAQLRRHDRPDLAKRVIEGEWDGTQEESEAWFKREGQHLIGGVLGAMKGINE